MGLIVCLQSGCVQYTQRFFSEVLADPATASPLVFPETVYAAPTSHVAALLENVVLACSLVGFVVLAPADEVATKALVRLAAAHVGPVFVRTGRVKVPIVYSADQKFEIGKAIEVVEGSDVAIIANGLLVAQAILAAETLESEGISARVIDMHTVKPLDREAITRAATETKAIVVADGTSCRQQIEHGAQREAIHVAQLLARVGIGVIMGLVILMI